MGDADVCTNNVILKIGFIGTDSALVSEGPAVGRNCKDFVAQIYSPIYANFLR
jgi:hypothetical protein